MKRKMRLSRICLALIIVVLGLLFFFWPKQRMPQWRMPSQELVGIDETQNLLYSSPSGPRPGEIRCYDLRTGVFRRTIPLNNLETDQQPYSWKMRLSPDYQRFVLWHVEPYGIAVGEIHTGKLTHGLDQNEVKFVESLRFNHDGRCLTVQSQNEVNVWDVSTGQLRHSIPWPPDSISRANIRFPLPDLADLSRDGRYLAFSTDYHGVIVYDLEMHKEVGRCSEMSFAHFLPDGRTLVVISTKVVNKREWYLIEEGSLRKLDIKEAKSQQPVIHICNADRIGVTFAKESDDSLPRFLWIPLSMRESAQRYYKSWFPGGDAFTVWDLATGHAVDRFPYHAPADRDDLFLLWIDQTGVISNDEKWFAFDDKSEITVWMIAPGRSWWVWAVMVGICGTAVFLVWPKCKRESQITNPSQ